VVFSSALAFVSGAAAQTNGNGELPDSVRAKIARADSARAQLVQPPGEYGGTRVMDVIRAPFRLFGATLALGAYGVGAGYYLLDKSVLPVARRGRAALSEVGVETDLDYLGTRSWPALVLRYEGLSPLFAEVGYSIRQYQHYSVGAREEEDTRTLELTGTYSRLREPHFWGVGPDSREEDRSDFSQDLIDVGGSASWDLTDRFTLSLGAGWEQSSTGPGWDDSYPNVQNIFSPATLFGLNERLQYARFAAGAELDETYVRNLELRGFSASAEFEHFEGLDDTRSRFQRVAGSAQLFVPVVDRTSIALQLLAEDHVGESGDGVPFTHLARLGSSHGLRGHSSRRYRDVAMAAVQLEWRYEAYWHPGFADRRLDAFVFADAGNVGPSLSSIQLNELHLTPGFGFRFMQQGRSRGEVYFGFGGDGPRVGFELGSTF
jgi:hypothetical protein